MINLKYHVDKIGILGSILSSLCCLGFPAAISFLSAVGAGFLINDTVLPPFLTVFLIISILGVFLSYLKHRNIYSLIASAISAMMVFVFLFVVYVKVLIYVGLFGLIVSSVYSSLCIKKCEVK